MNYQQQIAINNANNAPRCGARARTTGNACKSPAMKNGRCRMHGGKSLSGKAHPCYKQGDYLKEIRLIKSTPMSIIIEHAQAGNFKCIARVMKVFMK